MHPIFHLTLRMSINKISLPLLHCQHLLQNRTRPLVKSYLAQHILIFRVPHRHSIDLQSLEKPLNRHEPTRLGHKAFSQSEELTNFCLLSIDGIQIPLDHTSPHFSFQLMISLPLPMLWHFLFENNISIKINNHAV